MVVGLGIIILNRFKYFLSDQAATFDFLVILLLVALLLAPMFPHVEIFGLKLLQEIRQEVKDVKNQINTISTTRVWDE